MAEIFENIGDDIGESTKDLKKTFKKNPILFIGLGVVAVAVYVGFNRKNANNQESAAPLAYSGYPETTTTDNGIYTDLMNQFSSYQTDYDSKISDMLSQYNSESATREQQYNDMLGAYNSLSGSLGGLQMGLLSAQEANEKLQNDIVYNDTISQMRANATMYDTITNRDQKAALLEANKNLAESIGLSYDNDSGLFSNGDQVLNLSPKNTMETMGGKVVDSGVGLVFTNRDYQYQINDAISRGASGTYIDQLNYMRDTKIAETGKSLAAMNTHYSETTDYTKLINQAKAAGAGDDVINNLTEQRNAKIKAKYNGVDPSTGKKIS